MFLFIPYIGGAILLFSVGKTIYEAYWAYQSKQWPSVRGKISESQIRRTRGKRRYSYQLLLQYRYEVDGEVYTSSRIVFGCIWGYQLIAREQQRRYPKGKRVDVYYSPDNPSMATLETNL